MKRFIFMFVVVLCVSASVSAGDISLKLGANGQIPAYLVLGPFPNPGTEKMTCRGFGTDYLLTVGGENKAAPSEGQKVASTNSILSWKLALCDASSVADFARIFSTTDPAVAYAYAQVVCPAATEAKLLVGSDDGVKVWLNGEWLHASHETRGVTADKDQVNIRLVAGTNRFLFKVDQHFGGWGLTARIVDKNGAPIPGLAESLAISASSKAKDIEAVVRSQQDKPGSIDLYALRSYEAAEGKIAKWMPWFEKSTDRAKPLRDVVKSSDRKLSAAGSSGSDKLNTVVEAATKTLNEEFDKAWTVLGSSLQTPKPLMNNGPAKENYIRVADGGRYFVDSKGRFFTPLGYNHNPEWGDPGYSALKESWYDPQVTERFFKHLRDSGINTIRMMLEAPAGGFILENPIGTFNVEQVAFLDNIFTIARKYDIKLWVTPWDTFWMAHTWDQNAYNVKNGGPVVDRVDFIAKREVIEAQKKRWKYIIDRWGNTDTVFCWELMNEIDIWWDASPEQVEAWIVEMRDFVKDYEKKRWGRNHMVAVSISKPLPEGGWAKDAFTIPGLDFATTHLYIGAANAPDEPIGPAAAIRQGVQYSLSNISDTRPYIDGENGPINRWIVDGKLDDQVFHNMVWAHLSSGGAGSGFRWPYRNPHQISEGMVAHLSRMSKFAKDVPWQKLIGDRVEMRVEEPKNWVACSHATKTGALVWMTSLDASSESIKITWPGGPNNVRYRIYDTLTGEWLGKGAMEIVAGTFDLPAVGGSASFAIVLE